MIDPDNERVIVQQYGVMVGVVRKPELNEDGGMGSPVFHSLTPVRMSLNDMEIIMDNWNQMTELRKKNEKVVDKNEGICRM